MSVVIEQDSAQIRAAAAFHSNAEIDRVTLLEATAKKAANWSDLQRPLSISVEFKPLEALVSDKCANIPIRFEWRAHDQSAVPVEAVTVVCTLEASYSLAEGYKPDPAETTAFQAANAVFNCWPFFREYVQSTVQRMTLPAPPVPFLRLVVKPGSETPNQQPARDEPPQADKAQPKRAHRKKRTAR